MSTLFHTMYDISFIKDFAKLLVEEKAVQEKIEATINSELMSYIIRLKEIKNVFLTLYDNKLDGMKTNKKVLINSVKDNQTQIPQFLLNSNKNMSPIKNSSPTTIKDTSNEIRKKSIITIKMDEEFDHLRNDLSESEVNFQSKPSQSSGKFKSNLKLDNASKEEFLRTISIRKSSNFKSRNINMKTQVSTNFPKLITLTNQIAQTKDQNFITSISRVNLYNIRDKSKEKDDIEYLQFPKRKLTFSNKIVLHKSDFEGRTKSTFNFESPVKFIKNNKFQHLSVIRNNKSPIKKISNKTRLNENQIFLI